MSFKKIDFKKKSVYVIEQIVEGIKNGIWKVGDKLPPEQVIAEEIGVSKTSVREALSVLRIVGVIESRAGDGTYVRKELKGTDIKLQALSVLERSLSSFDILEARRAVEIGISMLAVDRATPEDLAQIKEALNRMDKAAAAKDCDRFLEAGKDFHLHLAKATKNPLIVQTISNILEAMSQNLWRETRRDYFSSSEEHLKESLKVHHQIFRALKTKNKELIVKGIEEHYKEIKEIQEK